MKLTGPRAGSDLGVLRNRPVPAHDPRWGEYYRITGQKIVIIYGEHDLLPNIIDMVLVRTPEAPPGNWRISLLLVPKLVADAEAASRAGRRVSPGAGSSTTAACCIIGAARTRALRRFPQPL